jgi:hypothetical protein
VLELVGYGIKRMRNNYRNIFVVLVISLVILAIQPFIGSGFALCNEGVRMKAAGPSWPLEIDGWKIAEGPALYNPATAFKYMNGAAELFIAYNMHTLTVVRYEKATQPAIILELYQMGSSEDAYGLFSFESDDPGAGIGQGSEFGGGLLRFWKGQYFISVYGDGPGSAVEATTLSLGRQIASSIKEMGNSPKILSFLPDSLALYTKTQAWFLHSHILLNQRFFVAHGNVLNLAGDVEAALGRYGKDKDKIHLLLIKYPSQAAAERALVSFKKSYMADGEGKASIKTENNKWTSTEKYGNYCIIVFDAPDENFALQSIKDTFLTLQKEKQ